MRQEEWPSADYPCLDCETAAEDHDVHPFFDKPSWMEGFARGYEEGRVDGEHLGHQALRSDLLSHLETLGWDVRLGLRHDLETPLGVHAVVQQLVEDSDNKPSGSDRRCVIPV